MIFQTKTSSLVQRHIRPKQVLVQLQNRPPRGGTLGGTRRPYKGAIFTCTGKTNVDGRVEGREWRTAYRALGCSPSIARPMVLHISMD